MESLVYIIRIDFIDRPGLGYDIFQRFELYNADKIGMEVTHGQQMMIKFRCSNQDEAETLIQDLLNVPGVVSVNHANYMPYEKREQELKTILHLDALIEIKEKASTIKRGYKITWEPPILRHFQASLEPIE